MILIASGSEVAPAMKAQAELEAKGIPTRVVSMPCIELFEAQNEKYKNSVLPTKVRNRICIEAGSSYSWYKYAGLDGKVIGIDVFGTSGPAKELFNHYGFTAENIVKTAEQMLNK